MSVALEFFFLDSDRPIAFDSRSKNQSQFSNFWACFGVFFSTPGVEGYLNDLFMESGGSINFDSR